MKKAELEKACVFVKNIIDCNSPIGKIRLTDYEVERLQCHTSDDVHEGDRVRIEKGRKYPIGTEGIVLRVCFNQFAGTFNSVLTGKEIMLNPSLYIQLDEGSSVWVCGDNCYNLTTLSKSIDGNTYEYLKDYPSQFGYTDDKCFWYLDKKGNPIKITTGISDFGLSVYKDNGNKYFTETEDEYVMVLDDWRSDTYPFLVIKKEIKSGNEVIYHRNGRDKRFTDMWDAEGTGLSESIKEYNDYLSKKVG